MRSSPRRGQERALPADRSENPALRMPRLAGATVEGPRDRSDPPLDRTEVWFFGWPHPSVASEALVRQDGTDVPVELDTLRTDSA